MKLEKDENGKDIAITWLLSPQGTELLGRGSCGGVVYWPDKPKEVIKVPSSEPSAQQDIEIEKRIYRRLGSHPNIVECLRIEEADYNKTDERGFPVTEHIVLKRAEYGTIREYFLNGGKATMEERVNWCRDIAMAVQYLHDHDVRHGDIGPRNILLDAPRTILLCDFAGSGIDGLPPRVRPQDGFKHPDLDEGKNGTIKSELHALGSTIYEIVTSSKPHGQIEDWMVEYVKKMNWPGVPRDELEDWISQEDGLITLWFRMGRYPNVNDLTLGDIISKCWKGRFSSAEEVALSIEKKMGPSIIYFATPGYFSLTEP
jgi:serine/threonine protein kinase